MAQQYTAATDWYILNKLARQRVLNCDISNNAAFKVVQLDTMQYFKLVSPHNSQSCQLSPLGLNSFPASSVNYLKLSANWKSSSPWVCVLIAKSEHPSSETLFLGCDLSRVSNFADFVFYIVTSPQCFTLLPPQLFSFTMLPPQLCQTSDRTPPIGVNNISKNMFQKFHIVTSSFLIVTSSCRQHGTNVRKKLPRKDKTGGNCILDH